jgi:hypothetical protein
VKEITTTVEQLRRRTEKGCIIPCPIQELKCCYFTVTIQSQTNVCAQYVARSIVTYSFATRSFVSIFN